MIFSKAIQIKQLVNRWNKDRSEGDFGYVTFHCSMFSIGNWAVSIKAVGASLFYSCEMNQLFTLYAGGGFMMRVSAHDNHPYIDMQ